MARKFKHIKIQGFSKESKIDDDPETDSDGTSPDNDADKTIPQSPQNIQKLKVNPDSTGIDTEADKTIVQPIIKKENE